MKVWVGVRVWEDRWVKGRKKIQKTIERGILISPITGFSNFPWI